MEDRDRIEGRAARMRAPGRPDTTDNKEKKGKGKGILHEILSTSIYLLSVLVITFLVITYVGQRTVVSGRSMEDTLYDRDSLIVDKLTYRFSDPKRFDIIVFPFGDTTDVFYIKRIIGMPGETVQIDTEGNIFIDGEILEESYGKEVIEWPGIAIEPVELGDDEYFLLGDNRNNSSDSRDPMVGKVPRSKLIGRAFVRIWPLNSIGILKHQ